jgi:serine protease Do
VKYVYLALFSATLGLAAALTYEVSALKSAVREFDPSSHADAVAQFGNASGLLVRGDSGRSYVLTAAHVVASHSAAPGYPLIPLKVGDRVVAALVVERADELDLALLEAQGDYDGPYLELADSGPRVGTKVVFVGCSGGLSPSVTTGVVSALGRDAMGGLDQCSCPTFPGASGGPILRASDGKVVGVVTGGSGETMTLYSGVDKVRRWLESRGRSVP